MTAREPSEVRNLDGYGYPALRWDRIHDALSALREEHVTFWLATAGRGGRPHVAGVGAIYLDGDLYIVSGPATRKSRDLADDPACTVAVGLRGIDLVFEGDARRVTDAPTLERAAARYRESGWPAEVAGDAFTTPYSAPSAGPPPWYVYRFEFHTVVGVAGAEPYGATRWRF